LRDQTLDLRAGTGCRFPTLTAVSVFLEGSIAPTSSPGFQAAHKNLIQAFSLFLSLLCALGSFYKTNEHELQGMENVSHGKLFQASKRYLAKDQRKAW
jgi:hypothetical protein